MPPDSKSFLSLHKASFRLGDELIFQNTSWTFHRHEHWAIIGPNGSGKSLLADALRGRLPLVQGELNYSFRPPAGLTPEEAIGHVSFEDRKSEMHGTVVQSRWNSIEEDGALRVSDFLSYERVMDINPFEVSTAHEEARARFERRRSRAISLLRIRPFLERTLLTLSNGETQRVQLARALCHPLRLLILDEPFTGLDVATRGYFHGVLERLMDTPVRVLLITTRMEDLPAHITHILRVEQCRVAAAGPRRQVQTPPESRKGRPSGAVQRAAATRAKRSGDPRQKGRARAQSPGRSGRQSKPQAGSTGAARPALVRLRRVSVRYGKTTILHNVDWTIEEGESWALLGPNGSGKSTLLSLLTGDHPQVYINEVEVLGRRRGTGESIWEFKQDIGWVSPELHLHFDEAATCFEVVASGFQDTIGLFEPPTPRQRAAASRWLAQFDLLKAARSPLYALSTGLQRMVLLARALVKEPRLLILDEPCQGLDGAHRELLVGTVDDLLRAGLVTCVYVTHRRDEIPSSIRKTFRLPEARVELSS